MLNIEEWKLKDLIFRRKKHIKSFSSLIENILCIIGFIASILLSNVITAPLYVKIGVGICGIIYLIAFSLNLYGSNYSVEAFYNDICSVAENEHRFSLILLKDTSKLFPEQYALCYDKRWKCWLFPYFRTTENNKKSVENHLSNIGIKDFNIEKITEQDFTKYSVSANMSKTYHHTFYLVSFDASKTLANKRTFKIDREKYRWYSTKEMKENKKMYERNSENIVYVEKTF